MGAATVNRGTGDPPAGSTRRPMAPGRFRRWLRPGLDDYPASRMISMVLMITSERGRFAPAVGTMEIASATF